MIILHFHPQPQFIYVLFRIYFISFHSSRDELNKLTLLPMCGFIAQLVEHRTGIAEVTGSNPVEALIFFRLLLSNCLKIYGKYTAMIILHFQNKICCISYYLPHEMSVYPPNTHGPFRMMVTVLRLELHLI